MNQNKLIGVIVVIVIAILGIWYFSSSNNGAVTGAQDETATTPGATGVAGTPASTPAKATSFRSIFTQTGNHQCSYEQVATTGRSSSVIYIADGKMRGEFRTTSGGVNDANLMIYDGGFLYSWKEGATTGKKSSIKSMAELPEAIPNDLTSGASFGVSLDNVSWDCHDWAKDSKMLVVPTYVKF